MSLTPFQIGLVVFDLIAFAATVAFIVHAVRSYRTASRKIQSALDQLAIQRDFNDAFIAHLTTDSDTDPRKGDH